MNLTLSDEQRALQATAADFLAAHTNARKEADADARGRSIRGCEGIVLAGCVGEVEQRIRANSLKAAGHHAPQRAALSLSFYRDNVHYVNF